MSKKNKQYSNDYGYDDYDCNYSVKKKYNRKKKNKFKKYKEERYDY